MPTDLSIESNREWHLSKTIQNSISLTGVMHTKNSYLRLAEGWVSTPPSFPWTDLYMWQKFLRRKDFKFITTSKSTILKFLGDSNLYNEEKVAQHARWFADMNEPGWVHKWDEKVDRVHQIVGADLWIRRHSNT